MFKVTIWNESIERTYNILTSSRKEAIEKAIESENEIYRTPKYKIHISETHKV
jgi:hypothetical protein